MSLYGERKNHGGGSVTVPGSNTQVIFNSAGALGASADLTWDDASGILSIGTAAGTNTGQLRIPKRTSDGSFGAVYWDDVENGRVLSVYPSPLTDNRSFLLPDASGTGVVTNGTNSGNIVATGFFIVDTAGGGLSIKEGSDAMLGTATLVAGTVTVSTAAVTANSRIFVFVQTPGGTQGHLSIGTVTASTSFVINSTSGSETSTVAWWIVEPA